MDRYEEIASSEEFKHFKKSKNRFIWPVVIAFIIFYLTLPLLAGYAKTLMGTLVFGNITFGYVYGLCFYLVAWGLAFLYVRKATQFDRAAEALIRKYSQQKGA